MVESIGRSWCRERGPHHIVAEQINAPEAETALHSRDAGS
jgi:hypothetical protein